MRRRSRGCWSASSSSTQAEAPCSSAPSHPAISLWSASGRADEKAGSLGVLVHLASSSDRRPGRQVGAVDDRDRVADLVGELGRPRRDRVARAPRGAGGGVDLGVDARAPPAPARPARRRRRTCSRPRRAAAGPPGRPTTGTPSRAGQLGQLAAGRGDQPLGAERLGGRVAGERLLGVARVARAEHRRRRPAPRRAARSRARSAAASSAGRRAPRRPGRRRSPSRPCRRRTPPGASIGCSRALSILQSASRRWSGSARTASSRPSESRRASASWQPQPLAHSPITPPRPARPARDHGTRARGSRRAVARRSDRAVRQQHRACAASRPRRPRSRPEDRARADRSRRAATSTPC